MSSEEPFFTYADDPELSGWKRWELRDPTRFNAFLGPLLTRMEGEKALVRMVPQRQHSNLQESTHGGALLGFMDAALFAAARTFGLLTAGRAVTLDLSAQFISTSIIGDPIVAEVELLRETGRMLFMRGLVTQHGNVLASFSGTVRKSSPPRA
ncbi:PaaI family thioesterase [Sphingomonas sp.]|uniref:PaaI family thioesterase n=1 Tax=Sphingomonas sp. TaxID=28214 RepID=UPI001EC28F60|nr:PaaI family thioesterase [Sphingomonas sp.]MBX3593238.1 PaaI family thioesterase [Sphingomonas sp.]